MNKKLDAGYESLVVCATIQIWYSLVALVNGGERII